MSVGGCPVSGARNSVRTSAAVTLVELLAAIVIVLALIAIALPVTNLVRSRSLVAECASNLSQIGKAVLMYADDHQGWLPCYSTQSFHYGSDERGKTWVMVVGRPKEWRDSLAKYTKSTEVFWCPADRNREKPFLAEFDYPEDNRQLYTSYQTQILLLLPKYWGPNGTLAIRLMKLTKGPSATYYIHDWVMIPPNPPNAYFGLTAHGRGGNGLLLDGSVRWHPEMKTPSGRN